MAKKVKSHVGGKVALGLAVLAAGAAGAYFLYGTKEGAKMKKQIKGWTVKMKGEILHKMESMKDVSEVNYHKLIDEAQKKYRGVKSIDPRELDKLVAELKSHWKNIKKEFEAGQR
ncbi:MAG: hypothetical protein WAV11_00470 [Minisyncoccia bacterium]